MGDTWGLIANFCALIVGMVLLVKGADWFVEGASAVAEKFGIPQIVIGLTIVAFGTSLPEAAVSITAAVTGSAEIAIGNVLGSNIANILLILGVCGLIGQLGVQKNTLYIEIPFVMFITVVLILLGAFDYKLGRWDGAGLLLIFALFFVYLIYISKKGANGEMPELNDAEEKEEEKKPRKMWLVIGMILLGLVMIVGGSNIAVNGAKYIAKSFGMSESFIALTIVALGTSMPELVTSIVAVCKKKTDLAIGNVVGSNIFNILMILGLTAVITPIDFKAGFIIDGVVALAAALMLFLSIVVTKNKKIHRWAGALMLASYIGYCAYLIAVSL